MSKAQCLECMDIVESKSRHDFVTCKCGNMFLDGGDDYLRYGAKDLSTVKVIQAIEKELK